MKAAIVCVLAAAALTLGACATTSEDTAALSRDAVKAELASVSQEILEIDSWVRGQVVLGHDLRSVMQNRAMTGRLIGLVHRQAELRTKLAEAGYPRTAQEVRERIVEIDQILARQDAALAPAGSSGMTSSLRTLISASPYPTAPIVIEGSASNGDYVVSRPTYQRLSGIPGSASPRSLAWQRTYRLQEERAALNARLQTFGQFEN